MRIVKFRALALRQRETEPETSERNLFTLDTLDFTIRICSTPTFLYFDLYLYSAAGHYVYINDIFITDPQFALAICRSYYPLMETAHLSSTLGCVFSKEYLQFFMRIIFCVKTL